jgi:hypothetical protein
MKDSMVTITLFISLLLIRATKAMFTFHLLTLCTSFYLSRQKKHSIIYLWEVYCNSTGSHGEQ